MIFKVFDDEENEIKEGNERPGSVAKHSLQQLLELEDSPKTDKASTEIDDARNVLAA